MKKLIIGICIVSALVLVAALVPLVETPYTVSVRYRDTETYYADEPYEVTETYSEAVPLDYEVVKTEAYVQGTTFHASVEVRNDDNVAGTFIVDLSVAYGCTFIAPGSIHLTSIHFDDVEELHLAPKAKKTARFAVDNEDPASCDVDSWSYYVFPSTKEVEKERTVTEDRQVERERTVTREREETRYKRVTVVAYLRSRF